ncbi:aminotransferase class V-fold PLP-dependent enzyme [Paracoccus litorisediminis]|uniref:Aminotransferase class V-fold PLP-dependent enzyme n=1 Tax=Paracoccus litorisediminis TaxID=2006130 RepID=A0A844HUD0_9RHOB|nr:aminotransferase class V-fold PLP-dependent enzyme [Paracoccus litorisediminis]MTH62064.1 aminotransferase class V-fold PLP-dependent enzyme [Paracoccus litorisediminis]
MSAQLDVAQLRAGTPGCNHVIHFNQAGAGLPPAEVADAMRSRIELEARHGPMETASSGEEIKAQARELAAGLIGCKPAELAFMSSTGTAWGMPVASLPEFRAADRILVSQQEWGGNLATLRYKAARAGATVEPMPTRQDGVTDLDALRTMIDKHVRLICLTWLPCNGGLIDDAEGIGRIAQQHDIPYIVDAAQAVGQIPVDVRQIGCDVLVSTARKHLRGPRGTALLYVREAFLDRLSPPWGDHVSMPYLDEMPQPRTDARRFESSEMSAVLMAGLQAALTLATRIGIDEIQARVSNMSAFLRQRLEEIPGVTVLDRGTRLSGLVAFNLDNMVAGAVQSRLRERGIAIGSNGMAYTPLDMNLRGLDQVARATVSYLTTEAEIDALCAAVRDCAIS